MNAVRYSKKNWDAIAVGENGESDDDFLEDSDSVEDYEFDEYPLVVYLMIK